MRDLVRWVGSPVLAVLALATVFEMVAGGFSLLNSPSDAAFVAGSVLLVLVAPFVGANVWLQQRIWR